MEIIRTVGANPDFRALVVLLDQDLWARYPDLMHLYVAGNIVDDDVRVVLAYQDGVAIGCGCLREFSSDSVEVKRMFVRPEYRGRGAAQAILAELGDWARELAFSRIILETGKRQPEAISLYEKTGFGRIAPYGDYAENDEESVCMEKILS
jgi:GNAT superfamily N-acetyltransferase